MKPISDTYYTSIAGIPLLTREQEIQLSNDAQGEDQAKVKKAIDTLVVSNLRLAAKIIGDSYSAYQNKEDLMSEATLGLYKAAKKFDASLGFRFGSYAKMWILNSINDYIVENKQIVRTTSHVRNLKGKVTRVSESMEEHMGRKPTLQEISAETGISMKVLQKNANCTFSIIPLDSKTMHSGEEGLSLQDTLEDIQAIRPDSACTLLSDVMHATELLNHLNQREKSVIIKRFGLAGEDPKMLEDIGKGMNVTRERIRQLQNQALQKMKKKMMESCVECSSELAYS
jgi:RNA polymerase primary sigma factor